MLLVCAHKTALVQTSAAIKGSDAVRARNVAVIDHDLMTNPVAGAPWLC